MNRLFDQFMLYVSYDEIRIDHINGDFGLGSFKTVDESTQAIDELITVIKTASIEDYISFSVDSFSTINCYSVNANVTLPKSNKTVLYATFTTNISDLDRIKDLALSQINSKLVNNQNKAIGGSDRLIHNLTAIKVRLQTMQNQFDVIDIINSMPKAELKQLIESNKLVSELRYLSAKDYIMED